MATFSSQMYFDFIHGLGDMSPLSELIAPCIPLMQPNLLRHRLVQHFTKVGGNGER